MFQYTDPAGGNFLSNSVVTNVFQQRMRTIYDGFARRVNSGFTWIEAFQQLSGGQVQQLVTVEWSAFPITSQKTDKEIDRDRFDHQDEYVEWHAEMQRNNLTRLKFTTKFPKYFEAFAEVDFNDLVTAIHAVMPGASLTAEEYRKFNRKASGAQGNPTSRTRNRNTCIVIGAGFAGLAAVHSLRSTVILGLP